MHSKDYREPQRLTWAQSILIVGTANSARDMIKDLSPYIPSLYQSVRDESTALPTILPKVCVHGTIDYISLDGTIHFTNPDSTLEKVDLILFATGYLYSFPFLPQYTQPDGDITRNTIITDGQRVHNLYAHLFYRPNPTLAFIALPMNVSPLPLSETQSTAVAKVWSQECILQMEQKEERRLLDPQAARRSMQLGIDKEIIYVNSLRRWWGGHLVEESWINSRREGSKRKEVLGFS